MSELTPVFVDLHSHSTASDGALAPEAVVQAAAAVNLAALALTDHDTVDGLDAAIEAGKTVGVRIIAGCELSAHDGQDEVHLLVLHIADTARIQSRLTEFRAQRATRAQEMVRQLNAHRVDISYDDVLRESAGGVIGRPHVARALVAKGYASDVRAAFPRYLVPGRPGYVPKPRLEVQDAIALAHDAGGLAIWAHPGRLGTLDRIEALVAHGLDGVEVLHPSHPPADVQRLTQIVHDLSLIPSGGSDWHGATEGYRVLGNMRVPYEWLERQDARVAQRRGVVSGVA